MYKQYPFQYSAPKPTTPPNNNNTTTDETPVEVPDKTPVEVTADDVIDAVKDFVALENSRKKEYNKIKDNGNWTNLKNKVFSDNLRTTNYGTKKVIKQKKTTDLTQTDNWTYVINIFTNKNTPVPKNMSEAYKNIFTNPEPKVPTNMYKAYNKAMESAHYTLNTYFDKHNNTDSIVNVLKTQLNNVSEQKEGIDSAIFIREFLTTKNVDIDPSDAVDTEPLQTFIQETKEVYVDQIINLENDNILKKNLKSVFIPKNKTEQTTAINAITQTLLQKNNEETAKKIRDILTRDMVNVRREINICLNEMKAIDLEQEKQTRRKQKKYGPPRRRRGPPGRQW